MKASALYDAAAAKMGQVTAIQAAADEEDRDLTPEEETQVLTLCDEAAELRRKADLARKMETTASLVNANIPNSNLGDDPSFKPAKRFAEPRDRDAEKKHGFNAFGEFASAVAAASSPSGSLDNRLNFFAAASGANQGVDSQGGFLVPPEFSQKIWDGLNTGTDSLLAMTDQYTVTGESISFNANAETSRVVGSRYGGVRGYWINEADQITSSKPTFRQITIEPQELAVLIYTTNKLLKNANALESYLSKAATEEINFLVGDAIFNGTGSGQPLGITAAACLISVAKETSQAADTIVAQNIRKMRARMHPNSWNNSVWFINSDVWPELDNLFTQVTNVAGSENVGGFGNSIWNPQAQTLYGRPVKVIEYAATIGDANDIVLADMKGYITGVRGGVDTAMSIHLRFDYAETAFRFMYAVDGRPWLQSALTPYKGTNTQSQFINLAARA